MIEKPKKNKKQTVAYWSKKADRKLQEICRIMYEDDGCLLCGGEYCCGHHVIPKSRSTHSRYNLKNIIPICVKCHNNIHSKAEANKVYRLMELVIKIKGKEWFENLEAEEKAHRYINAGYTYYRDKHEKLCLLTPYKTKNLLK